MKIIHTSDWHIGKKLNGRSRIDEQREVLNELVEIADDRQADLCIVAGDVFDTFMPSADAEQLFFETLDKLATEKRAVLIIGGNHDDWQRLSASACLASKSNVYIFGGENVPRKYSGKDKKAYAEQTGRFNCVINAHGERLYVGVLPYPSPQRFNEKKSESSFDDKMKEWIDACFAENKEGLPEILVSHIFMLGGKSGEGERDIELGGTRLVNPTLIPEKCLYTALGHLHKRQIINRERHILYSGAILQYSFDEAGTKKSVTFFEIKNGSVIKEEEIEITKGKKLARLSALSVDEGEALALKYPDFLVQLKLCLSSPMSEEETRRILGLKNVVELKLESKISAENDAAPDRRTLNEKEAFSEYYKSRYGEEVPDKLLTVYLKLMQEGREK